MIRVAFAIGLFLTSMQSAVASPVPVPQQDAIKHYMDDVLMDPYSAVYYFEIWNGPFPSGAFTACGKVNSKNEYGAYTGKTPFVAFFTPEKELDEVDLITPIPGVPNKFLPPTWETFCS